MDNSLPLCSFPASYLWCGDTENSSLTLHTPSRFTKDLKPADISLNFLTGKGELHNLELNAEYITEVLQLPPWIHISRVVCNTIRAHVPFTSLRNDPVHFVSSSPSDPNPNPEVVRFTHTTNPYSHNPNPYSHDSNPYSHDPNPYSHDLTLTHISHCRQIPLYTEFINPER